MDDMQTVNEGINRMVSALEKMAVIMSAIAEEQARQSQRLTEMERQIDLTRQYALSGVPHEKLRQMLPPELRGY